MKWHQIKSWIFESWWQFCDTSLPLWSPKRGIWMGWLQDFLSSLGGWSQTRTRPCWGGWSRWTGRRWIWRRRWRAGTEIRQSDTSWETAGHRQPWSLAVCQTWQTDSHQLYRRADRQSGTMWQSMRLPRTQSGTWSLFLTPTVVSKMMVVPLNILCWRLSMMKQMLLLSKNNFVDITFSKWSKIVCASVVLQA